MYFLAQFFALFTLLSSLLHFPFPISPCAFPSLHVPSASLFFSPLFYLPLSICFILSLILGTCRWHGAWPDKVIPQCRGLPGRDSLDTVSLPLAGGRLQRERRPELEWGGEEERKNRGEVERERTGMKLCWNQKMEQMFKCEWSSCVWHSLNETQRRGDFLMYFVLSLSLSTSIKS